MPVSGASGLKAKPSRGNNAGCSISSSNSPRCYLSQKHQNIFDPGKGKTQRGYLWLYITAQGAERAIVLYDCQPGCSGQYARDVLEGWRVTLVVDGDAGYQTLFGKRPGG